MAAYEKQHPEAPVNAAYYGQPIRPPQPPYYPPPPPPPPPPGPPPPRPAPRRGGPRCLLGILVTLIVALGVATLVLRLISRPYSLKAYADSAALSRFDLGGGGDDLLQYNLTVDIRLRNPSRFGVRCDHAEAQAFYGGGRFGFDPLRPFYLDGRSDARITATFGGSAVVDGDDGARRTYRRESGEGFYYVEVKVYSDLRFRVRTIVRRRGFRSKITCVLRLPVPAAGGGVNSTATMTTLGTRCDVDF